MSTSASQAKPNPLAVILQLGRRARNAEDEAKLGFILVNETYQLSPYRQAALWLRGEGIVCLSGVVSPEGNAPYVQWLTRLCRQWESADKDKPWQIEAKDLTPEDAREWSQWLPAQAICVPVPRVGQRFPGGMLILAREVPWTEGELALLDEWVAIWASTRALIDKGGLVSRLLQRLHGRPAEMAPSSRKVSMSNILRARRTWIFALIFVLLVLPVRLTVLAPADLVPMSPSIVRAPIDGVIDHVFVVPNETVSTDTPLFEFDRTSIRNRLLMAERSLDTVRAELRQRSQQALIDPTSTAQAEVLQGQVAEKQIELEYLRELDKRSLVTASRPGIVLFDDPVEWIGRPVMTGERVMVIADEQEAEVEAWLAPADAIDLEIGSRVSLYLNSDPTRPLQATLRYLAHEAVLRPDGQYAYRVRASLSENNGRSRIGLKGTARLEGDRVPVIYWVLRRPIAAFRAWLGV